MDVRAYGADAMGADLCNAGSRAGLTEAGIRYGHLRALREEDAPLMLEWMHDPTIAKAFQVDFMSMTLDDALAFVRSAAEGMAYGIDAMVDASHADESAVIHDMPTGASLHFAMIDMDSGAGSDGVAGALAGIAPEYLGTISLKNVDQGSRAAEYAIATRAKAQGSGVARAATEDLLQYAFDTLGLETVYLNVLVDNTRAIRFYEKVGFESCAKADLVAEGILHEDDTVQPSRGSTFESSFENTATTRSQFESECVSDRLRWFRVSKDAFKEGTA